MNVISFEKAYCLFPRATIEEHMCLFHSSFTTHHSHYPEDCGLRPTPRFQQDMGALFGFGARWLGDSQTWTIPLNPHGIALPLFPGPYSAPLPFDPVRITSFSVHYDLAVGTRISFSILRSQIIRYSYVVGDRGLLDHLRYSLDDKEIQQSNMVYGCCLDDWT